MADLRVDLIGKCFVIWGAGREVNYQGYVVGAVEGGVYLVQFFEAISGTPATYALYSLDRMVVQESPRVEGTFEFFEDDKHLRNWMQNTYSPPRKSKKES